MQVVDFVFDLDFDERGDALGPELFDLLQTDRVEHDLHSVGLCICAGKLRVQVRAFEELGNFINGVLGSRAGNRTVFVPELHDDLAFPPRRALDNGTWPNGRLRCPPGMPIMDRNAKREE